VAGWIKQHSHVLLRLMTRDSRTESDCVRRRRIEVADLKIEVHHRSLGTVYGRPDGSLVISGFLEHDVDLAFGCSKDGCSWLLVTDGPAEQFRRPAGRVLRWQFPTTFLSSAIARSKPGIPILPH
jgi:hypothetical protein